MIKAGIVSCFAQIPPWLTQDARRDSSHPCLRLNMDTYIHYISNGTWLRDSLWRADEKLVWLKRPNLPPVTSSVRTSNLHLGSFPSIIVACRARSTVNDMEPNISDRSSASQHSLASRFAPTLFETYEAYEEALDLVLTSMSPAR